MAEIVDFIARYCTLAPPLQTRPVVNRDTFKMNRMYDIQSSKSLPTIVENGATTTVAKLSQERVLPIIYLNQELYENLGREKDKLAPLLNQGDLTRLRNIANPFEVIGSGQYGNRAASKLASINTIYDLFPRDRDILVTDIAGGPGSWSQYVLTNYPRAKIIGISLQRVNSYTNWNREKYGLSDDKFEAFYGKISYSKGGKGDLLEYWEEFSDYVRNKGAVDTVMADGGIGEEEGVNENLQEQYNIPLIFAEIVTGLRIVRKRTSVEGGNMVIKLYDLHTSLMGDIILIVNLCFSRCVITKPITSRPANSEKYLVCLGCNSENDTNPIIEFLSNKLRLILSGTVPHYFFNHGDQLFYQYLVGLNTTFGNEQLQALKSIISAKDDPQVQPVKYDLSLYCKIIGLRDSDTEIFL